MLAALSKSNYKCLAWETEKVNGPFFCPVCQGQVVLKKGKIKEHHYAHRDNSGCMYGTNETQIHYKCKREIYQALLSHKKCLQCEMEKQIDKVRPDIFAIINHKKVAIEVQKTDIDIDKIYQKTIYYNKKNINVLWLTPYEKPNLLWREKEGTWVYKIKEWEKYIHSMYYGRIYYWRGGLLVCPYHFDKFDIYREEREWYDYSGELHFAGGDIKTAISLKVPMPYINNIHIIENFSSYRRNKEFNTNNWSIPKCAIWKDSLSSWWKNKLE